MNENVLIFVNNKGEYVLGTTIIDVAEACGYSKTTISRAFASPEKVAKKTRDIIYNTAKELNYTPDAIARAMSRKKTDNIVFIVNDQQYPVVLNPFYSPIFEGVLQEGRKRGYSIFIASDSEIHLSTGQVYMKKQMDGVIICGQTQKSTIESFRSQNIPVIILNNVIDMDDLTCISVDHYGGAYKAVQYLIDKGYKDIALIAGQFSPYVNEQRLKGYIDCLIKNDIPINEDLICDIEPNIENSIEVVTQLLTGENRPSAIFATNDDLAIGAVKAALRLGLSIPKDVAVVGFDDSDFSKIIEPELTTVRINKREIGRLATAKLIDIIEKHENKKELIISETSLIVRETT